MNWQQIFVGLMIFCQIGEFLEDISKISDIVETIKKLMESEQVVVRYAAIHAIGQLSEDCAPDFQSLFHDSVFPSLLKSLEDPVKK